MFPVRCRANSDLIARRNAPLGQNARQDFACAGASTHRIELEHKDVQ